MFNPRKAKKPLPTMRCAWCKPNNGKTVENVSFDICSAHAEKFLQDDARWRRQSNAS